MTDIEINKIEKNKKVTHSINGNFENWMWLD